jgi:hypothetical protein
LPGGTVQTGRADVLQAWQQPKAEEVGEGERDDRGAVGVDVVAVYLGVGGVAHQSLDHRGDLGGRAVLELGVDARALSLDVPVDHHAGTAVAGVPLGVRIVIEPKRRNFFFLNNLRDVKLTLRRRGA